MTKEQAIQAFWSSFGLPAYDVNTVPTRQNRPEFPYITYRFSGDSLDSQVTMEGDLWYYGTSWSQVDAKKDEIARAIKTMNPPTIKIDTGRIYLTPGTPFSQRLADPENDMVRRIFLNIVVEYFTNY